MDSLHTIETAVSAPTPTIRRRIRAYLLSPKLWLGGLLVFLGTNAYDAFKMYRTESRDDVKAVTAEAAELVKSMPQSSVGVAEAQRKAANLFVVFNKGPAREYLSSFSGELESLKARYVEQEAKEAQAKEAQRRATEQEAASKLAAQRAAEALAAQTAEAARLQAEAKVKADAVAAAEARARQQAEEAGRAAAQARQDRFDRMPK